MITLPCGIVTVAMQRKQNIASLENPVIDFSLERSHYLVVMTVAKHKINEAHFHEINISTIILFIVHLGNTTMRQSIL